MHKQVVIIGAGPAGLLLARLLSNRGVDCIILENRNKSFLRKSNRGGFLEQEIVAVLQKEKASTLIREKAIPLTQFNFHINEERLILPLNQIGIDRQAFIYDQKNIVADLVDGLKADKVPIIFEAKAQRYEGLDDEKVKIIYTLNGQLFDMTGDYVVGCDGFRGISRRSIPMSLRKEVKEELPYAWLEWIVDAEATSKHPIIALQEEGFAMQTLNANGQTRYYLQVERGIEMDDLPQQNEIWDIIESRLATKINRGAMLNMKLDYMRSFYTDTMQFGRLFIAGDAAHQVPRLGSKGMNMAFSDAIKLTEGFFHFYKNKDSSFLEDYTQRCLNTNLNILEYTNRINHLFHKKEGVDYTTRVKDIQSLLMDEVAQEELVKFLVG